MQPIDIDDVFTYHPPTPEKAERHQEIRQGGRLLAHMINDLVPDSPEKTLAIRKIQAAVMWANAALAYVKAPLPEVPEPRYDVGGPLPGAVTTRNDTDQPEPVTPPEK